MNELTEKLHSCLIKAALSGFNFNIWIQWLGNLQRVARKALCLSF